MAQSSCAESWNRVNVVRRRYSLSGWRQKSLLRIVNDREDKRWLFVSFEWKCDVAEIGRFLEF